MWFWALLIERTRQLLEELHGDEHASGGGWARRASTHDVERAAILARREIVDDPETKTPPHFLRDYFAGVTEVSLRRIRRYLAEYGFDAYRAGQIAQSAICARLAAMPTLNWDQPREHGRRSWSKQFSNIFGTLYILDIGCGRKSWTRWLAECALAKWTKSVVIVTIDWDPKMTPSICADITTWRAWLRRELNSRGYGGVRFHIVHFAAECTEYSMLKNGLDRDLPYANWLALSGMNMIIELKPLIWLIECAGSGPTALRHQSIMNDPLMEACHVDLTLCNAGTDYRKESSWWTNIPKSVYSHYGFPERPCSCAHGRKCLWELVFARHPRHVGGSRGGDDPTGSVARDECMMYPELLCAQWIASALHCMLTYEEFQEASPC